MCPAFSHLKFYYNYPKFTFFIVFLLNVFINEAAISVEIIVLKLQIKYDILCYVCTICLCLFGGYQHKCN